MRSAHSAYSSPSTPELKDPLAGWPKGWPSEWEGAPETGALLEAYVRYRCDALEPFVELFEALIFADAEITAPILSHTRASAEANQHLLEGKTPGRRVRMIGAWAIATVLKLQSDGTKLTQAKFAVAEAAGVSMSTIEKWCNNYRADNAELALDLDGRLFQRLRFKVNRCLDYADSDGISGAMMCRYLKTQPELVRKFSACQALIKTSARRKKSRKKLL